MHTYTLIHMKISVYIKYRICLKICLRIIKEKEEILEPFHLVNV